MRVNYPKRGVKPRLSQTTTQKVYKMEKLTKAEIFQKYAQAFNFELNADEVLQALYDEGILLPITDQFGIYSLETHGEDI